MTSYQISHCSVSSLFEQSSASYDRGARPESPGLQPHPEFAYPPRATAYAHVSNPSSNTRRSTSGSSTYEDDPRRGSNRLSTLSMTSFPPSSSGLPQNMSYPPLSSTWARLKTLLSSSYPELADTVNYPTTVELLNNLERQLNMPLPSSVRESYLCADGQDEDGGTIGSGIFFGLNLMPIEEVLREWQFWRRIDLDPRGGSNAFILSQMSSVPPGFIQPAYSHRGWVPLISDKAGNYVGVDLDPGERGAWGQVIVFGRDFDRKCVLVRGEGEGGWGRWLSGIVDELEAMDVREDGDDDGGKSDVGVVGLTARQFG